MNEFWIGIDVSKRKLDVACLDVRDKIKSRVFTNDAAGHAALKSWLIERGARIETTHICLESTGPYSEPPAIVLADASWKVSVVNPARPKAFAETTGVRNKTDKSDAALLARFCAKLAPDLWTPPSIEQRKLRALVDRLQALKDMHLQESNRLEGQELLGQESSVKSIHEHLAWLDARIAELKREIDDHIDSNPTLKHDAELMTSVPGVGNTTVAKVLAYVGDLRRFSSAKALSAYIGVTPRQKQSGTSVRGRTMISRAGHATLRSALFMPAMVALQHNPTIKAFGERLGNNGLARKAVVAASMHKLVHLLYGVVRSGLPFDPIRARPRVDTQVRI
jgi:transposase